ncbi:MAG TPA: phage holin family protein [Thermoanaerobaculia bacterium]|nr:phage holin family protein [Thermoanaerobaculia bacterium]
MKNDGKGIFVLSRELAADLLELADAEIEAAREEVRATWRRSWLVPVMAIVALFFLFWTIALFAYFLITLFALKLPTWGAALAVFGLFLVLAAVCGGIAAAKAKQLENPYDVFVRRLRAHLDWWRSEISLRAPAPGSEGPKEPAP